MGISKKFFHPSSFRNQEKLWKVQTADEREKRKQAELEKRREEERQVEEIRKQMYLVGQTKDADFLSARIEEISTDPGGAEQIAAFQEQKRRKTLLRQEHAKSKCQNNNGGDSVSFGGDSDVFGRDRVLAKSVWSEDTYINGHNTVWGSWYDTEEHRWGFSCCKTTDRAALCNPETHETSKPNSGIVNELQGNAVSSSKDAACNEATEGDLLVRNESDVQNANSSGARRPSLMDEKMVEAAARRRKRTFCGNVQESQTSLYLGNLLHDPTLTANSPQKKQI